MLSAGTTCSHLDPCFPAGSLYIMLIPVCVLCDSGAKLGSMNGGKRSEMCNFRTPDVREAEIVTFHSPTKLAVPEM